MNVRQFLFETVIVWLCMGGVMFWMLAALFLVIGQ